MSRGGRQILEAVIAWARQNLLLLLVFVLIFLQFLTWRAVENIYVPRSRTCIDAYESACKVVIINGRELATELAAALRR